MMTPFFACANASARADLPLAVDHFRYFAGWSDKIHGKTIPKGLGTLTAALLAGEPSKATRTGAGGGPASWPG